MQPLSGFDTFDLMLGLRDTCNRVTDRCFRFSPCLTDPAWRNSLCLQLAVVMLHLVYAGVIFFFDKDLIEKTRRELWYLVLYLLLFVATLVQYFLTACSSPGYVLDAMRAANEKVALFGKTSMASNKNGSAVVTAEGNQLGKNISERNGTSWTKLVMEMYYPRTTIRSWTCAFCNILQPPRAKHCHECGKCVLQFDHHCFWLGSCIGKGNHCRFWWYLCEETALCLWTSVLCITYLVVNISKSWWIDLIMILLLGMLLVFLLFCLLLFLFHSYLILTNQTTYEVTRRRRISYLRGIPQSVHPFSKGACRNLYNFSCTNSIFSLERLPTELEIEEKLRPYTCVDVLTCRCCC